MFNLAQAQLVDRQYTIPFTINGQMLEQPLAGGLNSCQMSRVDVNLDGLQDLFFFDRQTARISIFLNMDGTAGTMDYQYTLDYNSAFPAGLRNWVLMRDMNCDGKKDICANTGSGMRIFWNTSSDNLSFSATSTGAVGALYDFGGSSFDATVFSIAPDVPAIADYEGDGDMDVWSWNDNAAGLYFFENRAADNGNCEIPDFECRGRWYGMFNEGPDSFSILFGEDFTYDFDIVNPRSARDGQHSGGTVLTIDLDQNGILDIIASDVTETYMAALLLTTNTAGRDSVFQLQTNFPQSFGNSIPVEIPIFPAGFYEDVDNDGIHDLIVCTNDDANGSEDRNSVWLYRNTGLNDLPHFEFVQNDFLQEDMLDLGTSTTPVVFDVDQDGLPDILLSNRRFYDETVLHTSRIWYLRNVGTINAPSFQLINDNWMDMHLFGWLSAYPSFYDHDNDGDFDLIIGDLEGELKYFENTAGAGNPCDFQYLGLLTDADNATIDVGQYAIPQWVDINDDGLAEMIVGELNGHINGYSNTGSLEDPQWTLLEDSLGHAVATSLLGIQGRAVPHFYKDNLDQWNLIMGTETGNLMHFAAIDLINDFELITNSFASIFEGYRSAPYMADLNGNWIPDLLLGNMAGGLGIYYDAISSVAAVSSYRDWQLYPNPASNQITFVGVDQGYGQQWRMHDLSGRVVATGKISQGQTVIDISNLPTGMYVASIEGLPGRLFSVMDN